ncbi:4-oxalocrotonate tautomerase [Ramlibacter terrae]|uniref:4-oxalocrotonate tautomerase n=1 Tax=Ramlibacter terrae TaxID=2732511 RepID=A0ABX6P5G5_9BURK|nr:4-oxalocrotonate tautomerase [Ramlibacter terrae]
MPTLQLKISPVQSAERHALLAQALTAITGRVLGKRAEVTAVLVDELPARRWFIGGGVPEHATALLEIRITAGTNTPAEKAAFIEAAFAELQQQLGPLEPASYVVVHELPATDWGYGGRTQEARRHARVPA